MHLTKKDLNIYQMEAPLEKTYVGTVECEVEF